MRGQDCDMHTLKMLALARGPVKYLAAHIQQSDAVRGIKTDAEALCADLHQIPHGFFPLEPTEGQQVWNLYERNKDITTSQAIELAMATWPWLSRDALATSAVTALDVFCKLERALRLRRPSLDPARHFDKAGRVIGHTIKSCSMQPR